MSSQAANPVARKINREAVVILGWGRAVLLQLAHPLVAAAIADYSKFHRESGGFVGRARRTIGAMLALTFGPPDDVKAAIGRINAIHDQVHGTLAEPVGIFQAGTPYSARDPRLLLWVHATLLESIVSTYELLVGPLTPAEKDAYIVEAAWVAHELGVDPADVPRDYAEIQAYLRQMHASGAIAVGATAATLSGSLLSPPLGPAAAPLFRLTRLVTIGLLPQEIRAAYGFAWDAGRARAFERAVSMIRGMRRCLPVRLREWPASRVAA
jgi:uncharacterized protein (DUF2236 family)